MDQGRWRRVEAICGEALKLSSHERSAYLDRTCGADTELRREVESLLVHEGTAERFLASPIGAVAAQLMPAHDVIGRRYGDYEITAKLGEGGMGEVYRARDRKLGREVAIKILPPAFATDRERMHRFEREARLLATVNHQYIGAIYGVIEIEGLPALVLELVAGETLSEALSRGPLALPRALTLAAQVSDALDHAHRRGIIHRDLKPSNIMLTRDGVKLLDFGVGKWTPAAAEGTITRPSTLTGEGAIVGTLHYMSPEQLEGRDADARSDIFSFGAVLFEILAGRKAFDGPSQASIIAAVIEAPRPRLAGDGGLQASRLDRILGKCLAKDPDERWQSARDLGDELRWMLTDLGDPASAAPRRRTRGAAIAASLLALIAVALTGWAASSWRSSGAADPARPIRFSFQPEQGGVLIGLFDLSADGTQLAYVARPGPGVAPSLYVRKLDQFETIAIPGTAGAAMVAFSPDGQWLAFAVNRVLKKARVSADATAITLVENVAGTFDIGWAADDMIYLVSRNQPIRGVSANGGQLQPITTVNKGNEVDHHGPELLPDGQGLLFTVHNMRNRFSIAAQPTGGPHRIIIESGFAPRYLPSGHLIFGRGSTLMAVAFDARRLAVRGDPVVVVEHVSTDQPSGMPDASLSRSGTLAYQVEPPLDQRLLVWVDREGRETPLPLTGRNFDNPSLSPDGKQIAFVVDVDGRRDIFTYELASGRLARLTQDGVNWGPLWTADDRIVFGRDAGATSQLVAHRPDGGAAQILAESVNDLWPSAATADGKAILVTQEPPTNESYLSRVADGALGPFPHSTGLRRVARLSPDGHWIAYTEFVSGRNEVFIQSYPGGEIRHQISVDGGRTARWRRDGKELYFKHGGNLFAVSIDTGTRLKWGPPVRLFEDRFVGSFSDYDVAPDGRFLMIRPSPAENVDRTLNVVANWQTELASRVPVPR